MDKNYVRIEAVVYVEIERGQHLEDGEDKFLESLPEGIDVASMHSEMWDDDEE